MNAKLLQKSFSFNSGQFKPCAGCILPVPDFGSSYLHRQPEMRRVKRPHSFDKICFKDRVFRVSDLAVNCLQGLPEE